MSFYSVDIWTICPDRCYPQSCHYLHFQLFVPRSWSPYFIFCMMSRYQTVIFKYLSREEIHLKQLKYKTYILFKFVQ